MNRSTQINGLAALAVLTASFALPAVASDYDHPIELETVPDHSTPEKEHTAAAELALVAKRVLGDSGMVAVEISFPGRTRGSDCSGSVCRVTANRARDAGKKKVVKALSTALGAFARQIHHAPSASSGRLLATVGVEGRAVTIDIGNNLVFRGYRFVTAGSKERLRHEIRFPPNYQTRRWTKEQRKLLPR